MEFEFYNKHYILIDSRNRIIDGWSDGPHPEKDTTNAICIDEYGSYQFRLFPYEEENPALYTMDGIPLYKWDGEQVIARAEEEIAAAQPTRAVKGGRGFPGGNAGGKLMSTYEMGL